MTSVSCDSSITILIMFVVMIIHIFKDLCMALYCSTMPSVYILLGFSPVSADGASLLH